MRRLLRPLIAALAAVAGLFAIMATTGAFGGSDGGVASAAPTAQQIGMKVLLITDSTNSNCDTDSTTCAAGTAYGDWVNTLKREGVPYDSMVTSNASVGSVPLPALSSTASDGTQVANYEGVVVATSGTEGMSTAQWTTLQTFEHQFSVRQVTAYAVPSSDYGLATANPVVSFSGSPSPVLTSDGATVFPYLNKVDFDPGTFGYEGTPAPPTGATVDTLISGPGGSSLLGVYTTPDGRQTMYQTFNENQFMLQSELLRHGELDWLARNTFFGDQRNYLETDVDDNFLSDDAWNIAGNSTTAPHSTDFDPADALREGTSDVTTAAAWSHANNFRIDMLFNGGGSVQYAQGCTEASSGDGGSGSTSTSCTGVAPGTDPVLTAFQSPDPATKKPYTDSFSWINHTWDHPNIDEGCATAPYIEAEINENTQWGATAAASGNPTTGGLGLTDSTDPTDALGNENPNAVVTGEHSGLANLIPGNPGQVDPPSFDQASGTATGGTLGADGSTQYVYAIADQFNTAVPGDNPPAVPAAPSSGNTTEESAASIADVTLPVTTPATTTGSVSLEWQAVCKAADYIIYRAPYTGTYPNGTTGTWSIIADKAADPANDFVAPTNTTTVGNGGAKVLSYTDNGTSLATVPQYASATPLTDGDADESAYEQNPNLDTAFGGTLDGGIKYFGADASKPYPNPSDGSFATGSAPASQYAAGAAFSDAGAAGIPRYPTNVYYNVASNAQEIDEYNTLYLPTGDGSGQCAAPRTDCFPSTSAPYTTITPIITSVDQGMFLHMMGNDPRPDYFHQTNMINVNTGVTPDPAVPSANALFYQTVQPLLDEYNAYFATNAPIEQLTMAQIGNLLTDQTAWETANVSQVTGSIEGNVVTVDNTTQSPVDVPLTGTTKGTPYAGTQSYWASAPSGTSTYTALSAWPAQPTTPVVVTPPMGPSPVNGGHLAAPPAPPKQPSAGGAAPKRAPAITYFAVQAAPKTVKVSHGKVTVSLNCKASKGRTVKGKTCAGTFTLTVAGRKVGHSFRFKSGKVSRITVKLPKRSMSAVTAAAHHKPKARKTAGKLVITTKFTAKFSHSVKGTLTIKG